MKKIKKKSKKIIELEIKKRQEKAYWQEQTKLFKVQKQKLKEEAVQVQNSFIALEGKLKESLKKLQKLELELLKKEALSQGEDTNLQSLKKDASKAYQDFKKSLDKQVSFKNKELENK